MIRRPPRSTLFPLHDALPIFLTMGMEGQHLVAEVDPVDVEEPEGAEVAALMRSVVEQFENYSKLNRKLPAETAVRSEEHTSELQSRQYLVCRLLLEKKKTETL